MMTEKHSSLSMVMTKYVLLFIRVEGNEINFKSESEKFLAVAGTIRKENTVRH